MTAYFVKKKTVFTQNERVVMAGKKVMVYSKDGLHLTEQFEGCKLTPYKDIKGVWTNGYGNTHNVDPKVTITQAQAEADLLANIQWAALIVNSKVTVELTQEEFDALVDFVFNVGSGNFESSTLLKLINQGNFEAAANEFHKWDKAGGVHVAGLLRRRLAEEARFRQGRLAQK